MSIPEKIISKWYWIVLFLVGFALVAALIERMTGIFTIAVPGFGRLWQGATTPATPTPPAGQ